MTDPTLPQSYDYELPYPPVPKRSEQDFGDTVLRLFRTPGGKEFGLRLWLWVSLLIGVVYLVSLPLVAGPYIEMFSVMLEIDEAETDPDIVMEQMSNLMGAVGAIVLPAILMSLAVWAAIASGEAALHRMIFRGEEKARIPLRFGKDELRVMGAQLLVYLIMIGVYIGMILLTIVTLGIGGLIAIPGGLFLMVFLALRFSSAAALSVKDSQFRFGESKGVTKNRMGGIFGAYALVFVLGYVAMMIVQLIAFFVIFGAGGFESIVADLASETFDPAPIMERLNSPVVILLMIVSTLLYSALMAIWYLSFSGIGASTVLWWMRDRELPPTEWEIAAQQYQQPPQV